MKCVSCHEIQERADFPEAAKCQRCHPEFDLPKNKKIVPEKELTQLPSFVFFSHLKHRVDCENCHRTFVAMKMQNCIDCHTANKASVRCWICHDLSQ